MIEFLKLFFKGAVLDGATDKIEKSAHLTNDLFLTLIFSDRLGIPNPLYYYTVELLPYLAEEIEKWEVRTVNQKTFLGKAIEESGEP